jgi:hypothetical protein
MLTRLRVSRYKIANKKSSLELASDRSAEGGLFGASLEAGREQRLIAAEETTS